MNTYNYGMIGLGVMGRNLLYNIADNGFSIIGFDLDATKVAEVKAEAEPQMKVETTNSLEDFVAQLETPRKILLMVPAGKPVDAVLQSLSPLMQEGDVVIDGGNSYFKDTNRRVQELLNSGMHYMGMGVSGGEKGARRGPSIMPGGNLEAYHLVGPMLEAISAKVGNDPCTAYMGKDAAGNYVKMVHNGIEYAIMQLITEAYDVLKHGAGLNNEELHKVFSKWNEGKLSSFLIEITRDIFEQKDTLTDGYLVDYILDKAGAKGTGKWTSQEAMDLGIALPTIDAAVTARMLSSYLDERKAASQLYPKPAIASVEDKDAFIESVGNALFVGFIISYAQGLSLLSKASEQYSMDIPLKDVVKIWRGGCIIRSVLLEEFYQIYSKSPGLSNILLDGTMANLIIENTQSLRDTIVFAAKSGIPLAGLQSVLAYLDAYSKARLPVNLLQAQRDYFGAHTYQRIDREGVFHTEWETKL